MEDSLLGPAVILASPRSRRQDIPPEKLFNIKRVDINAEIPSDVEALVLFGAKADLTDWQLFQIDQFVMARVFRKRLVEVQEVTVEITAFLGHSTIPGETERVDRVNHQHRSPGG